MFAVSDDRALLRPLTIASFTAHPTRCVAQSLSCSLSLSVQVDHAVERDLVDLIETLHECEAAEHIDASFPRQFADRLDHGDRLVLRGVSTASTYCRSIRMTSACVWLRSLTSSSQMALVFSSNEGGGGFWSLPDCIRSDLPDRQIGLLCDDVGIEPPKARSALPGRRFPC